MINESELLEQFAEMEIPELREAARAVTGWAIDSPEYGNARNVSGLRVGERVFSRRLDSRTAFASDNRYGPGGALGAWTGSDRRAAAALRRVLRALSVPHAEIAGVDVQAEFGQVAEVISEAAVRLEQPELLRKLARGTRAIGGISVWSSYALVALLQRPRSGSPRCTGRSWRRACFVRLSASPALSSEALKCRKSTPHGWSRSTSESYIPLRSVSASTPHQQSARFTLHSTTPWARRRFATSIATSKTSTRCEQSQRRPLMR